MQMQENVNLAQYTTFKIGGPARFFCTVATEAGLMEAVSIAARDDLRIMVLGGGSNMLVSDAGFPGMVIKNEIKGKSVAALSGDEVRLSAGAGELWDDVVEFAVENGLYGIENLSAIPGTAGAAPVQNIGAYGAEIGDAVLSVRALDTKTMWMVELSGDRCEFGYRDSIFKRKKGRYVIVRVDLKLTRKGKVNIDYIDLKEYFRKAGAATHERLIPAEKKRDEMRASYTLLYEPTLREVRDAVIDIRWRKLPDWKLWGTAGSFFKNPVVSKSRFEKLRKAYPDMPGFSDPSGRVKVSLGWILDKVCDLKGHMVGNVGNYSNQALVLVAKPGATASEVVAHAKKVIDMVEEKTGLKIEAEVEWVN